LICNQNIKMINNLKLNYKEFGDATIFKIEYRVSYKKDDSFKEIDVFVNCYNWQLNTREEIKITFQQVHSIRFIENTRCSTVIFEALLIENEDDIIVDFFPIQIDGKGILKEDPQSDFSIHCKEILYCVL